MNGTRTRARTGRPGFHGAPVDGANALQIGYDDAVEALAPPLAPPRRRSRPRTTPRVDPPPQPPPLPVALPRASFILAMVGVVVVGVLGVLVLNTKINVNAFRLDDLHAKQAALDLREQQLTSELADLESPGNLSAAARRLGLVPAGTPAFINLPDGRVVGVPQPAAGATSATGR